MSASSDMSGMLEGLGAARQRGLAAATLGVDRFGAHVIGDSQTLAPNKTGALAGGGTIGAPPEAVASVDMAHVEGGQIVKLIGHNTNYAAAVHERLDVHHTQGQAKYLETAVRNNAPKMAGFVADQVRAALG